MNCSYSAEATSVPDYIPTSELLREPSSWQACLVALKLTLILLVWDVGRIASC